MERTFAFEPSEYYHVYNRGVDKRKIFFTKNDQVHFQRLLYLRNSQKRIDSARVKGLPLHTIERGETIVDIVAYALMKNHFHILLREKQEGGISTFMNKLGTSQSMFMNQKYERTGPLMCRPFRARHIDSDEYFRWVMSYIHLNPRELTELTTIQEFKDYPFSSYRDYYGEKRDESLIIEPSALPFDANELEDVKVMEQIVAEEFEN